MIGKTVSHYRINRQLGAGGMGIVYEATDTALDRSVALKFLPSNLTADPHAKARFIHEAKAASALDHSNVCTIHEIGETDDGQLFMAMACYQGETLRARIQRGPLPLDEAMDITRRVADGLAAAHDREIVHRDIKPANIFLTHDGQVKVLDFGLAKLEGQTQITKTGATLGTASYMSPEQARGLGSDQRSDLWCLGTVLYEMVTGQVPFPGENAQAVIHGITTVEPTPVTGLRSGVPLELERIIQKCMAKDPRERYQRAADLLADLRHLDRTSTGGSTDTVLLGSVQRSRRSRWPWVLGVLAVGILATAYGMWARTGDTRRGVDDPLRLAVLPFENLGDPSDDYFAAGIADEILTQLCAVPEIGVISRESAFQFLPGDHSIADIGARLDVDYVLHGAIRWQRLPDNSSRVRITPKLVSVSDNSNLWAEAYEEDLVEIFAVQESIGRKVLEALNVTLRGSGNEHNWQQGTTDTEAYRYFLRARELNADLSNPRQQLGEAESLLERATQSDPDFARAYAWLSIVHGRTYNWGFDPSDSRRQKGRAALDEALRLNRDLPDVSLAAGFSAYAMSRDYASARAHLERVRELRPNDSFALYLLATFEKRQGNYMEAIETYDEALRLSPINSDIMLEIGICHAWTRRFVDAERVFREILTIQPSDTQAKRFLTFAYINHDGAPERAREVLDAAGGLPEYPDARFAVHKLERNYEAELAANPAVGTGRGRAHAELRRAELYHYMRRSDDAAAAADVARLWLEEKSRDEPGTAQYRRNLGLAYAFLGQREDALREGQRALDLTPFDTDAMIHAVILHTLAKICALIGENDLAMDHLETLLSIDCAVTGQYLRADPLWEPLYEDPRFVALTR